MKQAALLLLLSWAATLACSEDRIVSPTAESNRPAKLESGTVVVFVHWEGDGLANKRVELIELGIELRTDDQGLATFVVPIGDYTVRVHEINRGGPGLLYVDEKVTVIPDEQTRIEIFDCLECV